MEDTETIFGPMWEQILEEITRDLEGEPSPSELIRIEQNADC